MKTITLLGDSTIDNKIWVDGIIWNYILDRFGIARDDTKTRIKKSHRPFMKPKLSIFEHLLDMMPNDEINDYTNDGFTSGDCLHGAYKDKVFGEGKFRMFPHAFFNPLLAAEESIKISQHIIISVGGNDFREFLLDARKKKDLQERKVYIKENFESVVKKMQAQYKEIINKIRAINTNAQLILMTQYYPAIHQHHYRLYPFMKELGMALPLGENPSDPLDVIHEIMKFSYLELIASFKNDPFISVADITSTLNPFDNKNFVNQIEPSGTGGKKIAEVLKYIILQGVPGKVYQFPFEFFNHQDKVYSVNLNAWQIRHPKDFL